MLSLREAGSALIEVVVIASVSFLIVAAAVSASIRIVVRGAELQEAARSGAIHGARHGDAESARAMTAALYPGVEVAGWLREGRIVTIASIRVDLPHPDGVQAQTIVGRAEMPLAPFRSARE